MARNGTDFGIRVSGLGDRWFTAPAQVPDGLYFPGFSSADANPDIGDSTITETAGIGAFAMAAAPGDRHLHRRHAAGRQRHAGDVRDHRRRAPQYHLPPSASAARPVGIDLRKVVELGITPRVNTGIAHRPGRRRPGRRRAGRPPMEIFEAALDALAPPLADAA